MRAGGNFMIFATLNDVIKEFKRLGWESGSNEGDRYVLRDLGNRVIKLYVEFDRYSKDPKPLLLVAFVSEPAFDRLASYIAGRRKKLIPLVGTLGWGEKKERLPAPITEEVIMQVAREFSDWALAQDMDAVKERLRGLPTDSVGYYPLMHLAALAEAGDVETLQSYADAFARGDRLGFVPYITEDYIARALEIAKERAAGQSA